MGELLANLVFIAIALLAWVLKAAMERKEQKQAEQRSGPRGGGAGPVPDSGLPSEVDVVYGRRKLPEMLTAPPAPVSSQTPEPSLASGGLEERPLTMGGLPSAGLSTGFDRPARRRRRAAPAAGGADVP
ncbi:MAG: hypothetical protein QNJ90_13880, partial [Planctomycetota bacterium]|nr:hypothetical protein [Planctomycetota bacterium]